VLPSLIETNTYFFGNDQHSVITVNIAGPTLSDGQWMGEEACHIEFFAPNGVFIFLLQTEYLLQRLVATPMNTVMIPMAMDNEALTMLPVMPWVMITK